MPRDRMFHVFVLGGIALVAVEGCGEGAGPRGGGSSEQRIPADASVGVPASTGVAASIDAGTAFTADGERPRVATDAGDAAAECGPCVCFPCEVQ